MGFVRRRFEFFNLVFKLSYTSPAMKTLEDFNFSNKIVLVRCDFNVPVNNGVVEDDFRIESTIPTIRFLAEEDAKVVLMSHLETAEGENLSLSSVKEKIEEYLGKKILMAKDCIGEKVKSQISNLKNGEILLLENLRFHEGEKKNDPKFAGQLAGLGDIYINDAFSVCHRAHASIVGIPQFLPHGSGLLLEKEIIALSRVLENPEKPLVAIIGGAKISSKTMMIDNFLKKADQVLLGGKIANSILQIKGIYKDSVALEGEAKKEVEKFDLTSIKLHIPVDGVVSFDKSGKEKTRISAVGKLEKGELILDIGPDTIKLFEKIIKKAKTIVWSGPMGLFEVSKFAKGTEEIGKAVAKNKNAFKVSGGGDTVSAISKLNLQDKFNHISTGGGAMLEFLGGKILPGIKALE